MYVDFCNVKTQVNCSCSFTGYLTFVMEHGSLHPGHLLLRLSGSGIVMTPLRLILLKANSFGIENELIQIEMHQDLTGDLNRKILH